MVTFITFAKLTEKGQMYPPEKAPEILNKVTEITQIYGGKIQYIWATGGRFDFVTIAEYPDDELAFKARVKIQELGLFFLESTPVFPVETYLKALREEKVPAFA